MRCSIAVACKYAAIEKQMSRARETIRTGIRTGLTKKLRQMLGDGGIGSIVQTHFHQCGAALALRSSIALHDREKTFEQKVAYFIARHFPAQSAANQTGSAAQDGERILRRLFVARPAAFLRSTALLPERMELDRIELDVLLRELLLGMARHREIHVVAAEQQVFADRHALKLQFSRLLRNGDQAEICRAAADVDNQNQIAWLYLFAPVWIALDPGIESGLRLFDDCYFRITGLRAARCVRSRAAASKEAGTVIKNALFIEGSIRMLMVPGRSEVRKILARSFDWRDLCMPSGAFSGNSGRLGFEGVRKPALGGVHEA